MFSASRSSLKYCRSPISPGTSRRSFFLRNGFLHFSSLGNRRDVRRILHCELFTEPVLEDHGRCRRISSARFSYHPARHYRKRHGSMPLWTRADLWDFSHPSPRLSAIDWLMFIPGRLSTCHPTGELFPTKSTGRGIARHPLCRSRFQFDRLQIHMERSCSRSSDFVES